jgi:hypothetical protein
VSPLTFAIIEAIPQVLQLVVGIVGLVFSIKGRPNGVPNLMVGAFVVMLVSTVAGLAWQFVSLNAVSWQESGHLSSDQLNTIFLGVDLPLAIINAVSWLLVAIAVLKFGRRPQQLGQATYFGPANYPMAGQPGFASPQPGYAQPGYAQPGYAQPGNPQPAYTQPAYPQPGNPQPGYPQADAQQPGYPQPDNQQPVGQQLGYPQPNPGEPAMPTQQQPPQ